MVESSITEEIKEENSEKSGSDSGNQSSGVNGAATRVQQSKMFSNTLGDVSTKNQGTQNTSSASSKISNPSFSGDQVQIQDKKLEPA